MLFVVYAGMNYVCCMYTLCGPLNDWKNVFIFFIGLIVLPLLVGFHLSYNYLDKEEGIFHKLPNETVLPPVLLGYDRNHI